MLLATGHQGQHRSSADAGQVWAGRVGRTCGSKDSPTGDGLRPTGSGEPDDRSHQVSRCRAAWRCCHDAVVTFSEMGRSQFSVASGNLTLLL